MSITDSGIKQPLLLFLLTLFCFDEGVIVVPGRGEKVALAGSGRGGVLGVGGIRKLLHLQGKGNSSSSSAVFNVKSFGAQANGHTDDTKNLKFVAMNKTVVRGIRSLNSKFFHIALVECNNFKGSLLKISAPANSPNTDGIHIERSSGVYFSRSLIGTGDDCISIGQGNSQVTVTSISCGPGHGISVGSLGKYPNEGDVKGLVVRDCNMTGTMNGIRIKTWPNSPGLSAATNMTFENIVMNNVTNPIIIDQAYCPFTTCASLAPSRVKLSDIYFRKIRGTSSSAVAVTLECSKGIPCQNIYLEDVHLDLLSSQEKKQVTTSSCRNVRVKYIGTQIPPPCD
ncbi:hypothetical protein RHMOL_Rhmol05G0048400 [Rhododendron molle]|uniref:Uncharacterized protein n=1 Tax=Rhododendron molle TaxID=49168 RepID=A0ACC0NKW3_RHOML|nr:hypothetical protein RHMOL_Rhmol05G0048400 [Rhododendron molle]